MLKKIIWIVIALIGSFSFAYIASARGEPINSIWLITAGVCVYLIGYRFYSNFIAAKILLIDENRKTPAVEFNDGRDYVPTNKWIVFGHHFAAIAGPGPLIGPTLAAQFGYLPGVLWILIGAVLGGCVQDMIIMFCSVRLKGKTLVHMAKEELGNIGGVAASIGIIMIMIILIAVLGLVVVNAMKHSSWATSTVTATIPIAMFIGIYMRFIRPGKILETSLIGFFLMIGAVIIGQYIKNIPLLDLWFNQDGLSLAYAIILYGFLAAVMPVWLLLAPRDYLSTFLKIGTILLITIAIIFLHPEIKMPAFTRFTDGTGPIFGGKIFPFMFITIACGAISGFHSLIASGTTPKLIENEKDIRIIGYGSMALESFVALIAIIAATIQEPGVFFAINSPAGIVGQTAQEAVKTISSWGFPVTQETMQQLANQMGETSLFSRTGGAPSLAVGMASILGKVFGDHLLAIWYHFAIMFEAVFILTTLDAGTRVCRFMLQDVLAHIYKPLGRYNWYPAIIITSLLAVGSWGYFLYAGVIDPNGGVNMLWPLFGMSNQILAAIALCIATVIMVKNDKAKYIYVTLLPMLWLTIITSTAAYQRLFSSDIRIGTIANAKNLGLKLANINNINNHEILITKQLIFNQYLVAGMTLLFIIILWIVIIDMLKVIYEIRKNKHV